MCSQSLRQVLSPKGSPYIVPAAPNPHWGRRWTCSLLHKYHLGFYNSPGCAVTLKADNGKIQRQVITRKGESGRESEGW